LAQQYKKKNKRERSIFSVISQIVMAGKHRKEKEIRTRPYKFVDEQKI
jgi:hypothetical protein